MSNDISGFKPNRNQQTQNTTQEDETADTRNLEETEISDSIEVADMASQLKSLEQSLDKQPDMDQDHINRVRDAIHRGEYQVNPERVAGKMMGLKRNNK